MKYCLTAVEISPRIEIDPAICNGRPVVKGTRIAVRSVLEYLKAGDSVDDIVDSFPELTAEDIRACLEWAIHLADAGHYVYPLPKAS